MEIAFYNDRVLDSLLISLSIDGVMKGNGMIHIVLIRIVEILGNNFLFKSYQLCATAVTRLVLTFFFTITTFFF